MAAHARFRRLPGAMRVLAVELCHYLDILITCAAAQPPRTVSPAGAADGDLPSQASSAAAEHGTGADGADEEQRPSQVDDPEPPEQQSAHGSPHAADTLRPSDQAVPPGDSSRHEGTAASSAVQSAPTLVRALYGGIVTFVLELLSDADVGAKPAEIAAPLQLHLRFLQIAQFQSAKAAPQPGPVAADIKTVPEQGLDLPAGAVQRLLRVGTPLTRLRSVQASAYAVGDFSSGPLKLKQAGPESFTCYK